MFTSNINHLSEFDCGIITGVRWVGMSMMIWDFPAQQSLEVKQNAAKKQTNQKDPDCAALLQTETHR